MISETQYENEDMRDFEIDFIAATFMFQGMSYEEARAKAVEEWREFNSLG